MAFKTLKTFYPPDPRSSNYEQEVTNALQQLSSEVNRLSEKVRELDLALTEHEAFYDAPIVYDQWWLSNAWNTEDGENVPLWFNRVPQNWVSGNEEWNGQYSEKFNGMFAGNNRKARTRYPHTLGMLYSTGDFTFPVTGLYRVLLTCVFAFHKQLDDAGPAGTAQGANPKVRMQFTGGSRSSGLMVTKNVQTVSDSIFYYPYSTEFHSIRSGEMICNVTRAADKELGQNFNNSVKQVDTVWFNTVNFQWNTFNVKLLDGREHLENGSTSGFGDSEPGGTNVIFQRIGPAIFDKPT